MKEIKFLNLANVAKIKFVKAVHDIKKISLKDAKDLGDAVYDSNVLTDWSTEVEDCDLQYAKDILEQLGINYCINDIHTSSDITPAINEMKNAGVYLEATESGIRVIFVSHVPDDEDLVRKACNTLRDAKCTVTTKKITFKHDLAARIEASKIFPPGIKDLDSILEFVNNVSRIFATLMDIRDLDKQKTRLNNVIIESFDKISW